jgi:hypothetical protein
MDVKSLANSINDIFVDLTNDFEPLTPAVHHLTFQRTY